MSILQETAKKATISPIFQPELAEIEQQLALWNQQYGSEIISQWLFDVAFNRLYESMGFEFASKLLTQTRYSLKRAEGAASLDWRRRCKKASEQPQVEAA